MVLVLDFWGRGREEVASRPEVGAAAVDQVSVEAGWVQHTGAHGRSTFYAVAKKQADNRDLALYF